MIVTAGKNRPIVAIVCTNNGGEMTITSIRHQESWLTDTGSSPAVGIHSFCEASIADP
jgi:hypothetical protein